MFLDTSGRKRKIQHWIQDIKGNTIRSFNTKTTRSSYMELEWDLQNDRQKSVSRGLYVWHIAMNGIMHTRTVNLMS